VLCKKLDLKINKKSAQAPRTANTTNEKRWSTVRLSERTERIMTKELIQIFLLVMSNSLGPTFLWDVIGAINVL